MSVYPGLERDCKACGAPLIFARSKAGKTMALGRTVKLKANVIIFESGEIHKTLECRVVPEPHLGALKALGVRFYLDHHADCPRADEFRTQRIRRKNE